MKNRRSYSSNRAGRAFWESGLFLTYLRFVTKRCRVCIVMAGGLESHWRCDVAVCVCIVTVASLQVAVDQIRELGPEAEATARASEAYIPNGRMG
jgi:hypothetical protein